jgi:excisionase family DNA binding protein
MATVIPFDRHRPNDASADVVYTVAEVAKLLRLSPGSTYALVRNGTIPAKKLGSRWVISKARFRALEMTARTLTMGSGDGTRKQDPGRKLAGELA